ncbi:hypothetical protein PWT90_10737 [Aphanocladium album]|nr:hypothetical protein PWT90_10737 [Aphanocladium album]
MSGLFFSQIAATEVVVHILRQAASASDVLALCSTCRRTNSIWRAHAAAILWPMHCRKNPGFDDALIASRITQQVADAQRRGDLAPTDVSPGESSGFRHPPSLGELEAACRLVEFGKAMQIAFFHMDTLQHAPGVRRPWEGGDLPEKPERVAEWQARVSRAIYRSLVLSASLAGSYTRPFFEAATAADAPGTSQESILDFLSKFAVYDLLSSPSSEKAVFGRAGAWLLEGILSETKERADFEDRFSRGFGRGEYCTLDECPLGLSHIVSPLKMSHSDAHLVVWKLAHVFWACENIFSLVIEHDSESDANPSQGVNTANEDEQSRALIVLFKSFKAEYVDFPKTLNWTEKPAITASTTPKTGTGWGKLRSPYGSCAETLETLNYQYINMIDNTELEEICPPPLGVKWVEYCLRHYLKLGFDPDAFAGRADVQPYAQFLDSTTLFAADDLEGRFMSDPDRWSSYGTCGTTLIRRRQNPKAQEQFLPHQMGANFGLRDYGPLSATLIYNCAYMPSICKNVKAYLGSLPVAGSERTFHVDADTSRRTIRGNAVCPRSWTSTSRAGVRNTRRCPESDQPQWTAYRADQSAATGPFDAELVTLPDNDRNPNFNRIGVSYIEISIDDKGQQIQEQKWTQHDVVMSCDEFPARRCALTFTIENGKSYIGSRDEYGSSQADFPDRVARLKILSPTPQRIHWYTEILAKHKNGKNWEKYATQYKIFKFQLRTVDDKDSEHAVWVEANSVKRYCFGPGLSGTGQNGDCSSVIRESDPAPNNPSHGNAPGS